MKLEELNGTYSAVASAIGGSSIAVLSVTDGDLSGWDISGTRYRGTVKVNDDGSVAFDVEAVMPPNTFAIWGTSVSETFQRRGFKHTVAASEFVEGRPILLPRESTTVIFRRIPDESAGLAGDAGLDILIDMLHRARSAWQQSER